MSSETIGAAERRGGVFVVLLLVSVFHGPALHDRFVYDDSWTIVQNPFIRSLRNLPALVTAQPASDLVPDAGRPTLLATLMIDYRLWAQQPRGYHLQSLLWHAAVSVLLFLLLARLTRRLLPALAGAGLFSVHPVLVEPVAAINYREDLLAAFFTLAALGLAGAARSAAGRAGRAGLRLAAALAVLVACGAKENAMMAPILLAVVDVCFFSSGGDSGPARVALRRRSPDYLFLAVPAGAVFMWRWAVLGAPAIVSVTAEIPAAHHDRLHTFLAGSWVLVRALAQLVLPAGLSPEYDEDPSSAATAALGGVSLCVLAALGTWAFRRRGRDPVVAAGLLGGLIACLPTWGLVPITNLRADRYLYLPAAFFLPALAALAVGALGRLRWFARPPVFELPRAWLAVGATLLALGAASHRQGRIWRDDLTLWTSATLRAPRSARAWSALGEAYLRDNRTLLALGAVDTSLALRPQSGHTHELRAIIAMQQGDLHAAEAEFLRAEALGVSDRAELQNNLGYCLLQAGRYRQALARFRTAERLSPRYDRPLLNAASAHQALGDDAAALADLRRLTDRVPESFDAWKRLGETLERFGDRGGALAAYQRGGELLPGDPAVRKAIDRLGR